MTPSSTADREIATTRLLDAPREKVWRAWTDPEQILKWWGPTGFTNTNKEMTVKPGGVWRFIMHGPDGTDWPNKIVYREVVQHERLVYDHSDDGPVEGNVFHVTVMFEEVGEGTKLTMHMLFETAAERDRVVKEHGALEGQKQTLDKLEMFLSALPR